MKLSKTERLLLSNQYLILAALYPEEREQYENDRDIVDSGYSSHYDSLFSNISDNELSERESRYVLDVLSVHRALNFSLLKLIRDGVKVTMKAEDIEFSGFDGNNEGNYLAYAEFYMDRLHKFAELQNDGGYNSHFPTGDKYAAMINKWENKYAKSHEMTEAQISDIISGE